MKESCNVTPAYHTAQIGLTLAVFRLLRDICQYIISWFIEY